MRWRQTERRTSHSQSVSTGCGGLLQYYTRYPFRQREYGMCQMLVAHSQQPG
ncbi:hypothetical protein CGRA01v4_13454 [Colletotrichum graminicola]|nr:hypothetical protein CGRA01v4_13454 [Colletotrichum graminicola]